MSASVPPTTARPRRALRRTAALLLVCAAGAGGAWWWAGQEGSLHSSLRLLRSLQGPDAPWLAEQVQGSLRSGGRIGHLRWQTPTHSGSAHGVALSWDAGALLRGHVPLHTLHIERLEGRSTPSDALPTAPTALHWPLTLHTDWRIDTLRWHHSTALQAEQLQGNYRFDGQHHSLRLAQLQWARGLYRGELRLQAAAPMALQAELHGELNNPALSTPLLPAAQQPATATAPDLAPKLRTPLHALARVHGHLSGSAAQLALDIGLAPRTPSARSPHLRMHAQVQPFAARAIDTLHGQWQGIDAAMLWPQAPRTQLDGTAQASRSGAQWQLALDVRNHTPGAWDAGRLPLQQLRAQLQHTGTGWRVPQLHAQWPGGGVQGSGQWLPGAQSGDWQVTRFVPAQWHSALRGPALSGHLTASRPTPGSVDIRAHLRPDAPAAQLPHGLQTHLTWDGQQWHLHQLQADWAAARLQASGQWHPQTQTLEGQAAAQAPGLSAQWQGQMSPTNGQGQWQATGTDTARLGAWLRNWQAPTPAHTGQLAPASAPPAWARALPPTWHATGQWQGGWQGSDPHDGQPTPAPEQGGEGGDKDTAASRTPGLHWQAQLRSPHAHAQVRGHLQHRSGPMQWQGHIWHLQWQGPAPQGGVGTPTTDTGAERISVALQSPLTWHWGASASTAAPAPALHWQAHTWHLNAHGSTTHRPSTLVLDHGHWQPARAATAGAPALPARAQLRADLSGVPLRWASWLGLPHIRGDAQLRGHLDLALQERPRLHAWLERSSGDIWPGQASEPSRTAPSTPTLAAPAEGPAPRAAAGLRAARATLTADGDQAHLALLWDSSHAGQLQAQLDSTLNWAALQAPASASDPVQDAATTATAPTLWPASAPLSGQVQAQLPQISAWSWLAPPGWRVQGTLNAQVAVSGTRALPQWAGTVQADQLAARSAVDGIEFHQGELRARLQDQRVLLDSFRLSGAGAQGGEVTAQGEVLWQPHPATPSATAPAPPAAHAVQMHLTLQAKQLRVSNRADRRLMLSGQVQARLKQGQMQLRGQVQADSASFILSDSSAPTLGKDVRIVGKADAPTARTDSAASRAAPSVMDHPDVSVTLDLGPDFQLQGQGIHTRLAGQVQLTSSAATKGQPRLHGQVRTEGGRYQAYGQQLTIEQGLLHFAGPYDNPALDILALRPNISQRVGARITGHAAAPRVRLHAEPELPEADKLAWLVLGRSPAAGGSESAVLQQAALALLSGNGKGLGTDLAQAIGFDDVSLTQRSTTSATGETTSGAAVLLGKRLSKDFYMAYESSVNGAFGNLLIFYELSRKLTLRAQTGEQSALDLLYTVRHD